MKNGNGSCPKISLAEKEIVKVTSVHTGRACCILILARTVIDSLNGKLLVSFLLFSLFPSLIIVILLNQQLLEIKSKTSSTSTISRFSLHTAKMTRSIDYCMTLKVNFYQRSDSWRSFMFLSKVMSFLS